MNFLENFQEYYEENVKPYETLYRQQQYYYNKEIRRKWIFGGFFMGGALIGFATTMNPLFIPLIIVCVIWTLVSVEREKNKYIKKVKEEIISPAIRRCFGRYKYSIRGVAESIFYQSNMYSGYDRFSSSDMIEGDIDGRRFIISEIELEEESRDEDGHVSYHTVFRGAFVKIQANYVVGSPIYIEPDLQNKVINSATAVLKKAFGLNKNVVRLENPEFERFFEAYSQNQVEARKVLTVDFLEKFLELRNRYNAKMYFSFEQNDVYMLISNLEIVDEDDIFKKGISRGTLYGNLKVIQDIMDSVELIANKQ